MSFAVAAVLLYLGICVVGRLTFRSALYPAPPPRAVRVPAGAELLTLRAEDGVDVHAVFFPPSAGSAARTVVHFHGNGEQLDDVVPRGAELAARGLGAVVVELRGYGPSSAAHPTEDGFYLDAIAVLDALEARGIGADRVALWGTSLGTGIAAEMARRGRGAALVLVTPYTSVPALARRWFGFLPTSLLVVDRFDTLAKAKDIRTPTLVIHGDRDELIPYAMGREVTAAIAGARLVTVPGGTHNDLFARDGAHLLTEIAAHCAR